MKYLGILGILIFMTSSRSSPPVRKDLEVPWNDPRTDRNRYPHWFSYNINRPDIQSRSGFFFIQENKVFWTYFNTECIPDHKHIRSVGYLNKNYKYTTTEQPEKICLSSILEDNEKLIYRVFCNNQKELEWTLYPYQSWSDS